MDRQDFFENCAGAMTLIDIKPCFLNSYRFFLLISSQITEKDGWSYQKKFIPVFSQVISI
jgi:hypothetical protein